MKKVLKTLVSIIIVLSLMTTAALAESGSMSNFTRVRTYENGHFVDVPVNQWFYSSVVKAYELGLMSGTGSNTFSPGGNVTVAETITLAARIRNIYSGSLYNFGSTQPWYKAYVDYAVSNGIIASGEYTSFDSPATRRQFVGILAAALPAEEYAVINSIDVIPDVMSNEKNAAAVYMFYRAGILCGSDDYGTFRPDSTISRSEVSAIINRIVDTSERRTFTLRPAPAEETIMTVGNVRYYIGMPASELSSPNERLSSIDNYTYYIYGSGNYSNFLAAGVRDNKVVCLISAGRAFNYRGVTAGSRATNLRTQTVDYNFVIDPYLNDKINAIYLYDKNYSTWKNSNKTINASTLAGESKLAFHLTNAFRVYHGLSPVTWSSRAAEAARLHSQEMADYNYFDHVGRNGSRGWDRMARQGISYSKAGENISSGLDTGFKAYNGWVNSDGHRKIMLGAYKYMGQGGGYNKAKSSTVYYTQDYYS